MRNYVSDISNRIKDFKFRFLPSRFVILTVLIMLSIISYLLGISKAPFFLIQDFWINLSAGIVGSIITIFLIDSLMHRDRKIKFKEVNKLTHEYILFIVRRAMAVQMSKFGFIDKKEIVYLFDNAEDKFKEFLANKIYESKFKELDKFDLKTANFLADLEKNLKNTYSILSKTLKELKPYPDPRIMETLSNRTPEIEAKASVGEDLINFYYKQLPKKISKKEISKMQPGMDILWKLYINGLGSQKESLKSQYAILSNLLLEIASKAKKEELFYEVE